MDESVAAVQGPGPLFHTLDIVLTCKTFRLSVTPATFGNDLRATIPHEGLHLIPGAPRAPLSAAGACRSRLADWGDS